MSAGSRNEARKEAPLPQLPRPLGDDLDIVTPVRRRKATPELVGPRVEKLDGKARNRLMVLCLAAIIVLPGLADACTPRVQANAHQIHVEDAAGVSRVKMEVGYRRANAAPAGRTYYQVISAPIGTGGVIDYRPPMASEFVSAMVLDATGPACD